jgi:hypothetical protein
MPEGVDDGWESVRKIQEFFVEIGDWACRGGERGSLAALAKIVLPGTLQ